MDYVSTAYNGFTTISTLYVSGKIIKKIWSLKNRNDNTNDTDKNKIVIDTEKKVNEGLLQKFFFGENDGKHIDKGTYLKFLKCYSKISIDEDIEIELRTSGGALFYSLLISNILYQHKGRVTCTIKNYAMSGGSLIALSCDEINIKNIEVMGPVDPQIFGVLSAKNFLKIMNERGDDYTQNTLERLINSECHGCVDGYLPIFKEILAKNHDEDTINKIIEIFFETEKDHSSIIRPSELKFLKNVNIVE